MEKPSNQKMTIAGVAQNSAKIIAEVEKAVVGKRATLMQMMAGFLSSGGHILLEDLPGMAKTLIANSLATAIGLEFKRIQFTPDLLPGDITGGFIFDMKQNQFIMHRGPVFTNLLLADEINRASPKTQSALLEAMQEYQVSLEGESQKLPDPFIVVATQNPIEYEGTFPLPEAQLDRFLLRLSHGYPTPEEEVEILTRRGERKQDATSLKSVITPADFLAMRHAVEEVYLSPDLNEYIVQIVERTRRHRQVELGASPRGSLALFKLSRAWAAVNGRDYVIPDDVKIFIEPALGHRLIFDPNLWGNKRAEQAVLAEIVQAVPVPVLKK
jgi:MoxR-like ATPase